MNIFTRFIDRQIHTHKLVFFMKNEEHFFLFDSVSKQCGLLNLSEYALTTSHSDELDCYIFICD